MINLSSINEIKNVVQKQAKYQKVMLIFDETFSLIETNDIYYQIKEDCIYNQVNVENLDEKEIYNGYKLIIYCLSTENYIKTNFCKDEFVNVFISKTGEILPYYLTEAQGGKNYLCQQKMIVDINAISSLYLSMFYTYFSGLVLFANNENNFKTFDKEITVETLKNTLSGIGKDMKFVDIDFCKTMDVDYKDLCLVDLLIVNAFLTWLYAIKNRNLMIIDVYKIAKDNSELIDKYYARINNRSVIDIVNLNFNYLYNLCLQTKEKILNLISTEHLNFDLVDQILEKIKIYSKNSANILNYLYLYNIFGDY